MQQFSLQLVVLRLKKVSHLYILYSEIPASSDLTQMFFFIVPRIGEQFSKLTTFTGQGPKN